MFRQIVLHPGAKIIIEFPSLFRSKFTSCLRGFRQNHFVIIDHPQNKNLPVHIEEGTACLVRFINEGMACGFKSDYLGSTRHPFPLAFLSYPAHIESSNLRQEERYLVEIETAFSDRNFEESQGDQLTGQILNLSRSGCLLNSPENYEPNSFLYLTITIPKYGRAYDIEVEVKSAQKSSEGYMLGLSFINRLNPEHKKLDAYLDDIKLLQVRI